MENAKGKGELKYLPAPADVPMKEITELQKEREHEQMAKFKKRFTRNIFVPIGCIVTAGVLVWGLVSMKRGNQQRSQFLMRLRILTQGATVGFILGGAAFYDAKKIK